MSTPRFDIVVPTLGRPSLARLIEALGEGPGPLPGRVMVVDDRGEASSPPRLGRPDRRLGERVETERGPARGPAAARNAGWRLSCAEWVVFLDDDVVPAPGWRAALGDDLARLPARVGGSQGRIEVPLPPGRRPTDWERNTAGLEHARWASADIAYRREALARLGGFDERFARAYREDSDLGLRCVRFGYAIARGSRLVLHPVRPAGPWTSLRMQAGNADDVLMRALHGRRWREEAGAPRGRLRRHLAVAGAGLGGLAAIAARRRRPAAVSLALWALGSGELAWARIAPGPRTPAEVAAMVSTSLLMPPLAALQWARGWLRLPTLLADAARAPRAAPPAAVLLDRDGTLVEDVPYNGDPARVRPLPGARSAVDRLRSAGIRLAVVSNQSGVARGILSRAQVVAVNRRLEELLGPLGPSLFCPHAPEDACACRKPRPGLVLRAAELLGVPPERCAVVGDIGADVEAARAAGARAVLVPTEHTRPEEIAAAPETVPDLGSAVDLLLGGRR